MEFDSFPLEFGFDVFSRSASDNEVFCNRFRQIVIMGTHHIPTGHIMDHYKSNIIAIELIYQNRQLQRKRK